MLSRIDFAHLRWSVADVTNFPIDSTAVDRRKHKILRRFLLAAGLLVLLLILLGSAGFALFRSEPEWYRPVALDPEQREQAAQSATNKLALIQNEAAKLRRDERMADRASEPVTVPSVPITVSFSEDELNAFFDKWAVWNEWKAKYERHITEPVILLDDGRIVLAARVRALNTVASLHFAPKVTPDGELSLELVRILGGRLPLPEAVLGNYRDRLTNAIDRRMPQWRRDAQIDSTGTPNTSAVAAAMGDLAARIIAHEPADAVLFLPMLDQQLRPRSVPVRLTDLSIAHRTLTLTVQPMTAPERAELLARIRGERAAEASGR